MRAMRGRAGIVRHSDGMQHHQRAASHRRMDDITTDPPAWCAHGRATASSRGAHRPAPHAYPCAASAPLASRPCIARSHHHARGVEPGGLRDAAECAGWGAYRRSRDRGDAQHMHTRSGGADAHHHQRRVGIVRALAPRRACGPSRAASVHVLATRRWVMHARTPARREYTVDAARGAVQCGARGGAVDVSAHVHAPPRMCMRRRARSLLACRACAAVPSTRSSCDLRVRCVAARGGVWAGRCDAMRHATRAPIACLLLWTEIEWARL